MKRQELSIGNFVYCPHLDPKRPYRVYIVDKIRPVWDGDGIAPGHTKDDARVVLTRADESPCYRKLIGERPGKFVYASQLKPIPIYRFFEECKERQAFVKNNHTTYIFCVRHESGRWIEIALSYVPPLYIGTRWFMDIYDMDIGSMRFPIFYFHQYQAILALYGLEDRYFSNYYFVEDERYEERIV